MIRTLFSSLFFVLVFSTPTMAGPRAAVDVKCEPMEAKLNYHCMIKLMNRKTKEPIPDAMIMIKADMPSMPMAHNVPPVHAAAAALALPQLWLNGPLERLNFKWANRSVHATFSNSSRRRGGKMLVKQTQPFLRKNSKYS